MFEGANVIASYVCTKCGRRLPESAFRTYLERKRGIVVRQSHCSPCKQKQVNAWKLAHADKGREYAERHKRKTEPVRAAAVAARRAQRERVRMRRLLDDAVDTVRARIIAAESRSNPKRCRCGARVVVRGWGMCRECVNKYNRARRRAHPEAHAATARRHYEKVKNTPALLMRARIRGRLSKAIHRYAKGVTITGSKLRYLGCTAEQAAAYISSLWVTGMTWGNYGNAWHIDHVIPCASFDLATEEGRARAFHYTNLQPLWAKSNTRKGDRVPLHGHQPRLLL